MAALKAFIAVMAMTVIVELATAATSITVGEPGGSWDLQTNFAAWAKKQTFTQGDSLIFKYVASQHDVLEVNKANYDSCSTSNPIAQHTSGDDVITLNTTTKRYFICGTPGHCTGGMKVEIDTVAAASGPSPPGTTPSPSPPAGPTPPGTTPSPSPPAGPTPPGTTPSPPSTTSPPPSGADGLRATAAAGFGVGMVMLLVL